jgi:anti-sigma B factor antagonist
VLTVVHDERRGWAVCRLIGELDTGTAVQMRAALFGVVAERGLIVDLCEASFLDSAGLGVLIGAVRRIRVAGGDVAVACARPALRRLLHTCGFDRLVVLAENVDAAIDEADAVAAAARG